MVHHLGGNFEKLPAVQYFQAVTFPKNFTDDAFMDEYNLAMMTLRETGALLL